MDLATIPALGSPLLVLGLGVIVVAGSMVQFGLGMGFGLTAAPLMALIDPELVPAPALMLGMSTAAWGAWSERGNIAWREVGTGMVGRIAGVTAAIAVLSAISDPKAFTLVFGLMVGLAVILSASGRRIAFGPASLLGMSALSGAMATITSVGAPPMALIYQDRPAGTARPTLAAFFAVGCAISLAGLFASGWADLHHLVLALVMAPAMLVGLFLARRLRGRFDHRYRPALLTLAGMAALVLVIRGLA